MQMSQVANHIKSYWESYLLENTHLNNTQRYDLMRWLLGDNIDKLETLTTEELTRTTHGLINRYQILRNRYLGVAPKQAYCNLFNRFGAALSKYPLLRGWITASKDNQKTVLKTIERMIDHLLKVDPYLRSQQKQISLSTEEPALRNAFLLTTLEEYCLHSINNYPLLLHLVSHFLRHQLTRSGTQQQHKLLQLLGQELQQTPYNPQTIGNIQCFPLQQPLRQIAFEEALKSYVEPQLVS